MNINKFFPINKSTHYRNIKSLIITIVCYLGLYLALAIIVAFIITSLDLYKQSVVVSFSLALLIRLYGAVGIILAFIKFFRGDNSFDQYSDSVNTYTGEDIVENGSSNQKGQRRIKCPSCGAMNYENASFCLNCGSGLASTQKCKNCGSDIHAAENFCSQCGERLSS